MKSIEKKEIIYFLLLGVIALMIFYLSSVLLPFFIGVFIAYLLDPCVVYLEKHNFNRGLSSIFILITFFLAFSFITFLILPILFSQTVSFLNEFPNIINELDLELLTIPNFEDLSSGRLSVSQIKQVDVEDLLGRESVNLDNSGLKKK